MQLFIQNRKGEALANLDLPATATVDDLKRSFAAKHKRYSPDRQSFSFGEGGRSKLGNDKRKTLVECGLKHGDRLVFKDLGYQVGWTTVFLTEYTGPLLLYLVCYLRPVWLYGLSATAPLQLVQHIAFVCWCVHYLKRDLETLFVQRFSNETMPWPNIFKNCTYYWGAAALVGYFVNHPLYTPPASPAQLWFGLGLFVLSELCNLVSHIQLRNLRPAGTTDRKIPHGFLFELVSCPNYFAEVLAWVGFTILSQTFAAALFTLVGFAQMYAWAVKKHLRYKREFDTYPKHRTAMIPFLL